MIENEIKIRGVVTEEVIQNENESHYKINSDGKEYAITSTGRQAVKDNLFIRKGQYMVIEGKKTSTQRNVLSEKSKILLKVGGGFSGWEVTGYNQYNKSVGDRYGTTKSRRSTH